MASPWLPSEVVDATEDLHAKITAAQQRLKEEELKTEELVQCVNESGHRQALRFDLEGIEMCIHRQQKINSYHETFRAAVDADTEHIEMHDPTHDPEECIFNPKQPDYFYNSYDSSHTEDYSFSVAKSEYQWTLAGMSWLANALKQEGLKVASSPQFLVGCDRFHLEYNPSGGRIGVGRWKPESCFAICHDEDGGINLRYRIFVKETCGDFTQWGTVRDECYPSWLWYGPKTFAPDVQYGGASIGMNTGILGLSHEELLQSQWVFNDALTIKVEVEVRSPDYYSRNRVRKIEVPSASLGMDLVSLFRSSQHSDITFVVEGERIEAHSAILCARSNVFERQLSCGMRESLTREVVIEDCDLRTFNTFLEFLYSDDLTSIESGLKAASVDAIPKSRNGPDKVVGSTPISLYQSLLSISHKYEVLRLQRWCEQKLCEHVCVNEVCSILCQAHLHEARHLELACLSFIRENTGAVVATPAFGQLTEDWPEVILKISIHLAGLSDDNASQAIKAQHESREKRQKQAVTNRSQEMETSSHSSQELQAFAKGWQKFIDPESQNTWWWHEASQQASWNAPALD